MQRRRPSWQAVVTLTILLLAPVLGPASAARGAPAGTLACDGDWDVVPSPNPGADRDVLFDVATLSPDDAWAVGHTANEMGDAFPLTLHWDGRAWETVANPVTHPAILSGVTMIAPDDVWAVGYVAVGLTETRPLAMHWDGQAWTRVPVPRLNISNLTSVSGTGPDDVWAVGMVRGFEPAMLVLHWDGQEWSRVPTPEVTADFVALDDVVAITPDSAWAVGYRVDSAGRQTPLSIFWNGRRWSRVGVGAVSQHGAALEGVTLSRTGEVWAVGRTTSEAGERPLALVRRDGAWVSPAQPVGDGRFEGVAPLPGGGVVAVGFTRDLDGNVSALAEVYTADGWVLTDTADVPGDDFLFDAATVPARGVTWAVGNVRPGDIPETLVERRCTT